MRKRFSLAVLLVALALAEGAIADTPADVYSDFAEDGTLSCGHSRAALEGVLRDASIHQYGDPYTLLGLKFAVRKQLAGGCGSDRTGTLVPSSGDTTPPDAADEREDRASAKTPPRSRTRRPGADESTAQTGESIALGSSEGAQEGHMVLLGVGLLLLALGSGGWAAKRAYSDRG